MGGWPGKASGPLRHEAVGPPGFCFNSLRGMPASPTVHGYSSCQLRIPHRTIGAKHISLRSWHPLPFLIHSRVSAPIPAAVQRMRCATHTHKTTVPTPQVCRMSFFVVSYHVNFCVTVRINAERMIQERIRKVPGNERVSLSPDRLRRAKEISARGNRIKYFTGESLRYESTISLRFTGSHRKHERWSRVADTMHICVYLLFQFY
jgi:hypothetical protein